MCACVSVGVPRDGIGVLKRESERARAHTCVGERETERERACVGVGVPSDGIGVLKRERESSRAHTCVCLRERERDSACVCVGVQVMESAS